MSPVIRNTLSALNNDLETHNHDNNGQLCPITGKTAVQVHKTPDTIE